MATAYANENCPSSANVSVTVMPPEHQRHWTPDLMDDLELDLRRLFRLAGFRGIYHLKATGKRYKAEDKTKGIKIGEAKAFALEIHARYGPQTHWDVWQINVSQKDVTPFRERLLAALEGKASPPVPKKEKAKTPAERKPREAAKPVPVTSPAELLGQIFMTVPSVAAYQPKWDGKAFQKSSVHITQDRQGIAHALLFLAGRANRLNTLSPPEITDILTAFYGFKDPRQACALRDVFVVQGLLDELEDKYLLTPLAYEMIGKYKEALKISASVQETLAAWDRAADLRGHLEEEREVLCSQLRGMTDQEQELEQRIEALTQAERGAARIRKLLR